MGTQKALNGLDFYVLYQLLHSAIVHKNQDRKKKILNVPALANSDF